jgi:hypothetical protein
MQIMEGPTMEVFPSLHRLNEGSTVNLALDRDAQYWSEKFGISKELLQKIVQVVGTSPSAVEHELEMSGARHRGPAG